MADRYAILERGTGVLLEYASRKPAKGTSFVDLGPEGADLAPGEYWYNQADGCFEPVVHKTTLAPDAHRALSLLIVALHEHGVPIPKETEEWLNSVDGGGLRLKPRVLP